METKTHADPANDMSSSSGALSHGLDLVMDPEKQQEQEAQFDDDTDALTATAQALLDAEEKVSTLQSQNTNMIQKLDELELKVNTDDKNKDEKSGRIRSRRNLQELVRLKSEQSLLETDLALAEHKARRLQREYDETASSLMSSTRSLPAMSISTLTSTPSSPMRVKSLFRSSTSDRIIGKSFSFDDNLVGVLPFETKKSNKEDIVKEIIGSNSSDESSEKEEDQVLKANATVQKGVPELPEAEESSSDSEGDPVLIPLNVDYKADDDLKEKIEAEAALIVTEELCEASEKLGLEGQLTEDQQIEALHLAEEALKSVKSPTKPSLKNEKETSESEEQTANEMSNLDADSSPAAAAAPTPSSISTIIEEDHEVPESENPSSFSNTLVNSSHKSEEYSTEETIFDEECPDTRSEEQQYDDASDGLKKESSEKHYTSEEEIIDEVNKTKEISLAVDNNWPQVENKQNLEEKEIEQVTTKREEEDEQWQAQQSSEVATNQDAIHSKQSMLETPTEQEKNLETFVDENAEDIGKGEAEALCEEEGNAEVETSSAIEIQSPPLEKTQTETSKEQGEEQKIDMFVAKLEKEDAWEAQKASELATNVGAVHSKQSMIETPTEEEKALDIENTAEKEEAEATCKGIVEETIAAAIMQEEELEDAKDDKDTVVGVAGVEQSNKNNEDDESGDIETKAVPSEDVGSSLVSVVKKQWETERQKELIDDQEECEDDEHLKSQQQDTSKKVVSENLISLVKREWEKERLEELIEGQEECEDDDNNHNNSNSSSSSSSAGKSPQSQTPREEEVNGGTQHGGRTVPNQPLSASLKSEDARWEIQNLVHDLVQKDSEHTRESMRMFVQSDDTTTADGDECDDYGDVGECGDDKDVSNINSVDNISTNRRFEKVTQLYYNNPQLSRGNDMDEKTDEKEGTKLHLSSSYRYADEGIISSSSKGIKVEGRTENDTSTTDDQSREIKEHKEISFEEGSPELAVTGNLSPTEATETGPLPATTNSSPEPERFSKVIELYYNEQHNDVSIPPTRTSSLTMTASNDSAELVKATPTQAQGKFIEATASAGTSSINDGFKYADDGVRLLNTVDEGDDLVTSGDDQIADTMEGTSEVIGYQQARGEIVKDDILMEQQVSNEVEFDEDEEESVEEKRESIFAAAGIGSLDENKVTNADEEITRASKPAIVNQDSYDSYEESVTKNAVIDAQQEELLHQLEDKIWEIGQMENVEEQIRESIMEESSATNDGHGDEEQDEQEGKVETASKDHVVEEACDVTFEKSELVEKNRVSDIKEKSTEDKRVLIESETESVLEGDVKQVKVQHSAEEHQEATKEEAKAKGPEQDEEAKFSGLLGSIDLSNLSDDEENNSEESNENVDTDSHGAEIPNKTETASQSAETFDVDFPLKIEDEENVASHGKEQEVEAESSREEAVDREDAHRSQSVNSSHESDEKILEGSFEIGDAALQEQQHEATSDKMLGEREEQKPEETDGDNDKKHSGQSLESSDVIRNSISHETSKSANESIKENTSEALDDVKAINPSYLDMEANTKEDKDTDKEIEENESMEKIHLPEKRDRVEKDESSAVAEILKREETLLIISEKANEQHETTSRSHDDKDIAPLVLDTNKVASKQSGTPTDACDSLSHIAIVDQKQEQHLMDTQSALKDEKEAVANSSDVEETLPLVKEGDIDLSSSRAVSSQEKDKKLSSTPQSQPPKLPAPETFTVPQPPSKPPALSSMPELASLVVKAEETSTSTKRTGGKKKFFKGITKGWSKLKKGGSKSS